MRSLRELGREDTEEAEAYLKVADTVYHCGRLALYQCKGCDGEAARQNRSCNHRLCSWCSRCRGARLANRLAGIVSEWKNPVLATFTLVNGFDLGERDKHLRKSWQKLYRREAFKACFDRGIAFWEATYNPASGWHVHLHVLLNGYMPQAQLSALWEACTGDSRVVDIRRLRGRSQEEVLKSAKEAVKYPVKLSDINHEAQLVGEFLTAMKGRRLMWSFGEAHGIMAGLEAEEKEAEKEQERAELELRDGKGADCVHCGLLGGMVLAAASAGSWRREQVVESINGWWVKMPIRRLKE